MDPIQAILDKRIPIKLLQVSNGENVIFCKNFKSELFDSGFFSTKEKDFVHNYITENNQKYIVTDVTTPDDKIYKNVKFRVVVNEKGDVPYCTFNPKGSLTEKGEYKLPEKTKLITEQNIHKKETAKKQTVILGETPDYQKQEQEYFEKAKKLQERLIKEQYKLENERKELEKQKLAVENEKAISEKLNDYKQVILQEFFNVSEKQEKTIKEKLTDNYKLLEERIYEQNKIQNEQAKKTLDQLNEKGLDRLRKELDSKIGEKQKEIEKLVEDKAENSARLLVEKADDLRKLFEDKFVVDLEQHKNDLFEKFSKLSRQVIENFVDEKSESIVEELTKQLVEAKKEVEKQDKQEKQQEEAEEKSQLQTDVKNLVNKEIANYQKDLTEQLNDLRASIEQEIAVTAAGAGEGGGGTNSYDYYPGGGPMNGNLSFPVSGTGIIFANGQLLSSYPSGGGGGGGDPAVNSVVYSNSANWNNTYTTVNAYSGTWSTGIQTLTFDNNNYGLSISSGNTVSLSPLKDNLSEIISTSASWNSNYTTTNNNSAGWSSVYTTTNNNSAGWSSVYTTTNNNSAGWSSVYTTTNNNSAGWSSVYTNVNTNSGTWGITGKTIFVDAGVGTDTRTGISKYSANFPFATITSAVAASVTGDLVWVRKGSYTITSTVSLDSKGDIQCEAGTIISAGGNITALSASETKTIIGDAFVLSDTAKLVAVSGGTLRLEFSNISSTSTGTLFTVTAGTIDTSFASIVATSARVFELTGSGGMRIRRSHSVSCQQFLYANTTGGATIDLWSVVGNSPDTVIYIDNIVGLSYRGVSCNGSAGQNTYTGGYAGVWDSNITPITTHTSIRLESTSYATYGYAINTTTAQITSPSRYSFSSKLKWNQSYNPGNPWYGPAGLVLSSSSDLLQNYFVIGIQPLGDGTWSRPYIDWKLGTNVGAGIVYTYSTWNGIETTLDNNGAIRIQDPAYSPSVMTVSKIGRDSLRVVINSPVDGDRIITIKFITQETIDAFASFTRFGYAAYLSDWTFSDQSIEGNLAPTIFFNYPQSTAGGGPISEVNPVLRNIRVNTANPQTPATIFTTNDQRIFYLDNVKIASWDNRLAFDSLVPSTSAVAYDVYSNRPAGSNITVIGDYRTISTIF